MSSVLMNLFNHKPLYGRDSETSCLQRIVGTVLREGDFVIDQHIKKKYRVGDCNGSVPTDSTSHSEEESSVNCTRDISNFLHRTKELNDDSQGGSRHLVFVSGPTGAGKRTLITNFLHQCCKDITPFILGSGRFKSMESAFTNTVNKRPFTAIAEALQEIAFTVSQQSFELRTALWQRLQASLKNPEDSDTLLELFPCIKNWFHEDDSDNSFSASGTMGHECTNCKHFTGEIKSSSAPPTVPGIKSVVHQEQLWFLLLQTFLRVIVSVLPVVFFLEDLHFADEMSLELVKSLLESCEVDQQQEEEEVKGLLIIATCISVVDAPSLSNLLSWFSENADRTNANPSSPNDILLRNEVERKPFVFDPHSFHLCCDNITQITVSDLTWDDVKDWVQAWGGEMELCSSKQFEIANLVFQYSNGNPFHIRYLLLFLEQDKILLQEPIQTKHIPRNVNALFMRIFQHQDVSIQKVVQAAALLAQYSESDLYLDVLEIAVKSPCLDIVEAAHTFGLIEYSATRSSICFCRESFRKAVQDTIANLSILSLDIGRNVWSSAILSHDMKGALEEVVIARVLLSTQLLQNSIDLLTDIDERIYMSQLCYEAGQTSSSLSDFYTSAKLYEFAICFLGSDLWLRNLYEASLLLHIAAAQAYCSIANYEQMNRTLNAIFDNATTFRDKLPAYLILVHSSGSRHQLLEAFRLSSFVLQELGESVSEYPSTVTVVTSLLRVKWALSGKTDQFLSSLPNAENAEYLLMMQFQSFTQFIGYMTHPNRSLILFCRMILSSLKHGICGPSALSFSIYAYFLSAIGDFEAGHRMGQLALQFSNRFGAWWPRIQVLIYGYVNQWTYPFRESIEPLNRIERASLTFGDLEIHSLASTLYVLTAINAGVLLAVLEPKSRTVCLDLAVMGQTNQLMMAIQLWTFINELQGGTKLLGIDGNIHDATSALNHCIKEGNKFMAGNFYVFRTMWCFFVGDYEKSLRMAKKAYNLLTVCEHALPFYEGLAALAMAWTSKFRLRRRLFGLGKKSAICIKRWADRCPHNFRNKQFLLDAEIAALQGKTLRALSLFEQSIAIAKHEAVVHEQAIAYERLGHYQYHLGNFSDAKISFWNSRFAYETWGAARLVDRLDDFLTCTFR
jgi:predicted ATPase